ncbi:hypothetical protein ACJX0J_038751, partial [Zea mays]
MRTNMLMHNNHSANVSKSCFSFYRVMNKTILFTSTNIATIQTILESIASHFVQSNLQGICIVMASLFIYLSILGDVKKSTRRGCASEEVASSITYNDRELSEGIDEYGLHVRMHSLLFVRVEITT